MLKTTREKINDEVYLNIINGDKFKTELISFYFIMPLNRSEVTKNTLVPLILKRGTKQYNTSMDIERRLEELYGSDLSVSVNKKGEKHIIRFTIEGPREDFVLSNDILKNKLDVLKELIYNPLVIDNKFKEEYVSQEKRNLKDRISSRINDKKQYSTTRCIEEMCKNEPYHIYKYGYIEDLENINSQNLYKHYLDFFKKSRVEINVVSNIEKNEIKNIIKDYFPFDERESKLLKRENVIKKDIEEKTVIEEMDIKQGKLTLGYRTNIPYEDDLYTAFLVGNHILGGGPDSKLFINVREKESLAYYIYSRGYKYKSLMLISAGIEFDKYESALNIIKEQIEAMKKGEFEEKNIEQSKKAMITSMKAVEDDTYSISEFNLSKVLTDNQDIDEIIDSINKVKKEDIINSMNKISLDTVYFLKNQ
ncbi:insulinase family protein [Clostridium sp. D2Q-14]|uniref:EF-P 5-aminopentanol modification-associated protein YfmF n=1 Tax=Anaeromonas gelatinilytica TaxID=2683194 RepID=UPI00193B853B|nr:pitrilysin family protein [Anaeromonas gelatinilytica]MBS4535423.1 insulinase family protein [Anaeromonas gelatinilytica]